MMDSTLAIGISAQYFASEVRNLSFTFPFPINNSTVNFQI